MIQGLYEIRKNESEKLFTMWLDAFHDYPKLAEAFPQMDKKLAAMEATIRFYGMYDLKYGHAYSTDENIDDGIVIVDSEDMQYTASRYIEAGCYSEGYKAAMNRLTEKEKSRRIAVFNELEELDANNALGAIEISLSGPDKDGDYGSCNRIPVLDSDTNTIRWLKKHSYYSEIDPSEYIVKSASLFNNSNDSTLDISKRLKGKTLKEIRKLYPCVAEEAGAYYELSLDLKRKGSSTTYYYSMSYSKKTLPEDFRDLILK